MEYLGELENNLLESDSDRKSEPEVAYHCADEDLEWGGVVFECDDSDEEFYVMRRDDSE